MTEHPKYVLLIQDDGGDYYVGKSAALYLNGQRAWYGYSNDEAQNILRALIGKALDVRYVKAEYKLELDSCWHPTLAEHVDGEACSVPGCPHPRLLSSPCCYGHVVDANASEHSDGDPRD